MSDGTTHLLLKSDLKQLRLPTISAEFAQWASEAASANESYEAYWLRLTEPGVATRGANALAGRVNRARFPVLRDLDT